MADESSETSGAGGVDAAAARGLGGTLSVITCGSEGTLAVLLGPLFPPHVRKRPQSKF